MSETCFGQGRLLENYLCPGVSAVKLRVKPAETMRVSATAGVLVIHPNCFAHYLGQ